MSQSGVDEPGCWFYRATLRTSSTKHHQRPHEPRSISDPSRPRSDHGSRWRRLRWVSTAPASSTAAREGHGRHRRCTAAPEHRAQRARCFASQQQRQWQEQEQGQQQPQGGGGGGSGNDGRRVPGTSEERGDGSKGDSISRHRRHPPAREAVAVAAAAAAAGGSGSGSGSGSGETNGALVGTGRQQDRKAAYKAPAKPQEQGQGLADSLAEAARAEQRNRGSAGREAGHVQRSRQDWPRQWTGTAQQEQSAGTSSRSGLIGGTRDSSVGQANGRERTRPVGRG